MAWASQEGERGDLRDFCLHDADFAQARKRNSFGSKLICRYRRVRKALGSSEKYTIQAFEAEFGSLFPKCCTQLVKTGKCNRWRLGVSQPQVPTTDVKENAHKLIDSLPSTATWDDVMYRIYVRQSIEAGLNDVDHGNTTDVKDVRTKYGLAE